MENQEKWINQDNFLIKVFTFNNFLEAIDFVNKVALLAEKNKHHPDIEIFSYKKVKIKLSTHDKGNQITQKDIELSLEIDKIK
ncbi:MAG: 4a-hydroxytetrahydrobiopterin dehydratase [Candidatus Pacebacteria bacterium]|nr:4a-hydroxytetrahydrobiopterin dehydratase [Candidatus Paceibacterota bacterium]